MACISHEWNSLGQNYSSRVWNMSFQICCRPYTFSNKILEVSQKPVNVYKELQNTNPEIITLFVV